MRIAVDAMGGDYAPNSNVDGATNALKRRTDLEVLLVGDKRKIDSRLQKSGYPGDRVEVVAAEDFVRMDEKPTEALRKKPKSSISVCWQLVASREVDAVVSAGNTGAVVAAGLRTRLFLKGVRRPGIAVSLPTMKGYSVLMDVGANPEARAEHLYQYAVMGAIYAREVLGIQQPKIGLMNIGSEEGKGNELYRDTHDLLSQCRLKDRYVGNVEGRGLYQGVADVLICEGFVGNVVLKVSEGMAEFMINAIAQEVLDQLDAEHEAAQQAFQTLNRRYQYSEQGGAPLLGIEGICIICHGSSNAISICNALNVATTFEARQINSQIVAELSESVMV